jgi:hypothetical protein
MAIGRLPVRTVEEAEVLVAKITGYEQSPHMEDVLLVTDRPDEDSNFENAGLEVATLFPHEVTVWGISRGAYDDDTQMRNDLLRSMNEGKLLVNYMGHGSVEVWRGNILSSEDAEGLTNGVKLPFLVSMTCLNGFFHDLYSESLAEAFLKARQGGALAVWGSSGLTQPSKQILVNKELIRLLFNSKGKPLTLGEATLGAKTATDDQDVRRIWILFGDPTTKLKN